MELVDLYPTVVEAAGLDPISTCPENSTNIDVCHEGMSLMPLVEQTATDATWRDAAFSWYWRDKGYIMG